MAVAGLLWLVAQFPAPLTALQLSSDELWPLGWQLEALVLVGGRHRGRVAVARLGGRLGVAVGRLGRWGL